MKDPRSKSRRETDTELLKRKKQDKKKALFIRRKRKDKDTSKKVEF